MKDKDYEFSDTCKSEIEAIGKHRMALESVLTDILDNSRDKSCYSHVNFEPIPSKDSVIKIINKFLEVVFPGYFAPEKIDPINLDYYMGQCVTQLYTLLSEQIINSIRHDCFRYSMDCQDCKDRGYEVTLEVMREIPAIRKLLALDIEAAYDGDPAAKNFDEIIFSYPGIFAITVYRLAHALHIRNVPLLPRIMTEYAHSKTGIDIHPGAKINKSFVIDHGTGVVIGETTTIGNNVRIYQGVTLGALSLPKNAGPLLRNQKRHPDIEDDVIIYSGTTILGGETVIGARSIISGNIWITESVPPDTLVYMEKPKLMYKSNKTKNP